MKAVLIAGMAGLVLVGLCVLVGAVAPIVRVWWRKIR